MSRDALLWLAVGGLTVLIVVLMVLVVATRRSLSRTQVEIGKLRDRAVDSPATAASAPVPAPVEREYLITGLAHGAASSIDPAPEPPVVDRALFADLVLREAVVKTASLAHGVRRAVAPSVRNRIRFEMRQEVRRSRKQRRADLKAAQRDLRAGQRARLGSEDLAEEAS